MTDLLGPASSLNAVSSRPSDGRYFGATDTFFRDCTTPASQDGTQVTAAWLNQVMGLFRGTIRGNGLKADGVTPIVVQDQSDAMLLSSISHLIQRGQATYGAHTGTADALAISPSGQAAAEYKAGMVFLVLKGTAPNSTTAPTLNVSGLGPIPITRRDGSALVAGDLPARTGFVTWYDGSVFRLTAFTKSDIAAIIASGSSPTGSAPICYVVDAGTADALVGPGSPTIFAYTAGQIFLITKGASSNATVTPTLAVAGLPPKTIVKANGSAVAIGDLPAGASFLAEYDGTNIRLLEPTASDIAAIVASFTPAPSDGGCIASVLDPTHIQVLPKNGGTVYVNGAPVTIPAAGLTIGNASGGVALAASTKFYLYLLGTTAAPSLEWSTTGHVTDNAGREVKSGDPTRRLLGMAYTNSASQFQNDTTFFGLLNYFNRKSVPFDTGLLTATTLSGTTPVPLGPAIKFLTWADDLVKFRASIVGTNTYSPSVYNYVDGAAVGVAATIIAGPPAASGFPFWAEYEGNLSEGVHTIQPYGSYSAGYSTSVQVRQLLMIKG